MSEVNIYIAETDVKIDSDKVLGFFGQDGFGDPLSLGEFNGRTFITDTGGSVAYEECDNCRRISSSGVVIGQTGDGINILNLPNYLATINLRFTHPESVLIQNAKLIAYDGIDVNNSPIGINVYGAEIIHTGRLQTTVGAGDSSWIQMNGLSQQVNLVNSPGTSGISPLGPATLDTRHDWYCAISVSPILPGNKSFTLRIELEFI